MIPFVEQAYAATTDTTAAFASVVDPIIKNVVDPLIMLAFAVAVFMFVWGVFQMFSNGDDPTARSTGRSHMIWGIVGIAIMLSAWGIMYFISNTLGEFRTGTANQNTPAASTNNSFNTAPTQPVYNIPNNNTTLPAGNNTGNFAPGGGRFDGGGAGGSY